MPYPSEPREAPPASTDPAEMPAPAGPDDTTVADLDLQDLMRKQKRLGDDDGEGL
jgi:hypothetical protein